MVPLQTLRISVQQTPNAKPIILKTAITDDNCKNNRIILKER